MRRFVLVGILLLLTACATAESPSAPPSGPARGSVAAVSPPSTLPAWHTVRRGESLSFISRLYYGDGAHWTAIVAANPEIEAHPLPPLTVGERLRIPALPTTAK